MANAIPVDVGVYVEDITAQMAAGYATLKLYRDSSPTGAFTSAVSGGVATLVAGTQNYTLPDAAGDPGTYFYRFSLVKADTTESPLSPLILPAGISLARLRFVAARMAGRAFEGTVGTGNVAYIEDAKLGDTGIEDDFLKGAWIYTPASAAADRVRRVASFTVASQRLVPSRNWGTGPSTSATYQVFQSYPPIPWPGAFSDWSDIARDGLARCYFVDQVYIGVGTSTAKTRFSLAPHAAYARRSDIRRVFIREVTDTYSNLVDIDMDRAGRFFKIRDESPGDISIELSIAPSTTQYVVVELQRPMEMLYLDTDICTGPEDLAVAAVHAEYWARMLRENGKDYEARARNAEGALNTLMRSYIGGPVVRF